MANTIGILAGMGPRSTAPFLNMVLDECQKQYGAKYDDEFPGIMIYSLPTPFYIDKPVDQAELKQAILEGAKHLAATGVDFIVMPCSTAHIFFDEIQQSIDTPIISMIEESITQIPDDIKTIGLIATKMTIDSQLYQAGLKKRGCDVIESTDSQDAVDKLILDTKAGTPMEELRQSFKALVDSLKNNGAQAILVACTDISSLSEATQAIPVFDAITSLARSTVQRYLQKKS